MFTFFNRKYKVLRKIHPFFILGITLLLITFILILVNALQQKTSLSSQAVYPCRKINETCSLTSPCCIGLECGKDSKCILALNKPPKETPAPIPPQSTCISPAFCLNINNIIRSCEEGGLDPAFGDCGPNTACCQEKPNTCDGLFSQCVVQKPGNISPCITYGGNAPGNCSHGYACCYKKVFSVIPEVCKKLPKNIRPPGCR